MRIGLAGDERALALHGASGAFAWGEIVIGDDADVVIDLATLRPPLPAADGLFDLPRRPRPEILVVGADPGAVLEKLRTRGAPARAVEQLTVAELEDVGIVALLGDGELPAECFAVQAAGRVLIAPEAPAARGLFPWHDHLPYSVEDELAQWADAASTYPEAFARVAALGEVTARQHRTSDVIRRLSARIGEPR